MHRKILTALQQQGTLTYTQLSERAAKRNVSLDELDELLAKVGKDKSVKSRVDTDGEIVYRWSPVKAATVPSHLLWVADRKNYPKWDVSGKPIPFYDPEYDGPTSTYTKATNDFYLEKNEKLKRQVESETIHRKVKRRPKRRV